MLTTIKETDNTMVLCMLVKERITNGDFADAQKDIVNAMAENPHSAIPHNLMGILMEHENNHQLAMKHFRAAWALDPAFRPSRFNMEKYGACFGNERFKPDAYEESDCTEESKKKELYKVEYDESGIGHIVKR